MPHPARALTVAISLVVTAVIGLGGWAGSAAAQAKRPPTYTSPHFKGPKTLPKNFVAAKPPAPVTLATDGHSPHVFVDAAGTAHLAWAENPVDTPSVMHYCRLPRGAKTCTASQAIAILQPATGGNGPATDVDFEGPVPLAIGNELVTIDGRCCNNAPIPGGGTTGDPLYLFTSEDGGPTFTRPQRPQLGRRDHRHAGPVRRRGGVRRREPVDRRDLGDDDRRDVLPGHRGGPVSQGPHQPVRGALP